MFGRPVDSLCPIKTYYGEKNLRFEWSMDPDTGFWIPQRHADGHGQHRGTDFDCVPGTPVMAMADGLIIRAHHEDSADSKEGAGLYILQLVIGLGYDNWVLKYSHLRAIYLAPGGRVRRGDYIAESGNSGAVQSPYLHVDLMNLKHQWKAIPLAYEPFL